jgi:hypothetical protein
VAGRKGRSGAPGRTRKGGPGRPLGDINTALERTIGQLERRISIAREREALRYADAQHLSQWLDRLAEQMEIVMLETSDYPDQGPSESTENAS